MANDNGRRPTRGRGGRPGDGGGLRPTIGTGERSARSNGPRPASNNGPRPASSNGQRPANSSGPRPANRDGARPANSNGPRPTKASSLQALDGSGHKTPSKYSGKKKSSKLGKLMYGLLCVTILVASFWLIASQARRYNALRAQYHRIQDELSRAQIVYADMRYQMTHFDSDAYIEQLARERLGWVMPNEIVFRKITE